MIYYVQCYRGNSRFNFHAVGDTADIEAHLILKGYDRVSFVPTLFRG